MKKTFTILYLLIAAIMSAPALGGTTASTRNPSADSLVIRGIGLVDSGYSEWKKDDMLRGYALLQRAAVLAPADKYVQYYIAYAGYRLMTYGMAAKQDYIYKEFADPTEEGAKNLEAKYGDWSEPGVLLAAIYGIEVGYSWMKGPTLGPKSNELVEKALAIDSLNPRVYLILGTSKFNTPAIFGGSVDQAVDYFKKSISLYEKERDDSLQTLKPTWGYIDALTWLGLAYEKQERYSDALAAYRIAVQADPNYARAKYVLIPEVEKKIGRTK